MDISRGDVVLGALVGYTASRVMDAVTTGVLARQSLASRQREEELAPGGSLTQLGVALGRAVGRELDADQAGRVGLALHRSFGTLYGVAATVLAARGVRPMTAGAAVATAAFLVVDEGTSLPLATSYPWESHLRGVIGHATWGLVAGALLALTWRR